MTVRGWWFMGLFACTPDYTGSIPTQAVGLSKFGKLGKHAWSVLFRTEVALKQIS